MDKHVFISYKHDDSDFAENLIIRVQKEGFPTWLDNESLHPGDDWREEIDQAIRDAFALIVIMSPAAEASSYVTYEWAFAWGCGIKIIPVMYKPTPLHPRLDSLQYLDFTNHARPWVHLMKTLQMERSKSSTISKLTDQKVHDWIEKGELFLQRKDYGEALDAFKQAILLNPGSGFAYDGKSETLYMLEKYRDTLAASEQAINLGANTAHAWTYRGNAYWKLKLYDEALDAYEQALNLDPGYARAWNGKGLIFRVLRQYDEALSAYDEALRLDPTLAPAWNNKGMTFYLLNRYSEALFACDEALRLDPYYAVAWNKKGDILKQLDRAREAEQCYKRARDLGYKRRK